MRTEMLSPQVTIEAASIARRGIARGSGSGSTVFSESLSAVSIGLQKSGGSGASEAHATAVARYLRAPTESVDPRNPRSAPPPPAGNTDPSRSSRATSAVKTPFDAAPAAQAASEADPNKLREWRDYFRTHAPSQWWKEATARERFAEIYGQQALVTLDWTCNVPENIDTNFVVHVPVDSTGKPIPRSQQT